jgi:DNA-binding PucR family transcriptional regulator
MTITTEEAEWLAVKLEETFRYKDTFTGIVTYHDPCGGCFVNGGFRSNTSTAIRSLAAERDALRAENARLREALRKARARYVELNNKDAAEAMAEIITEVLGDDK